MTHDNSRTRPRAGARLIGSLAVAAVAGVLALSGCGTGEPTAAEPSAAEVVPGAPAAAVPDETVDQDEAFYADWAAQAQAERQRHEAAMEMIDNLGPSRPECASRGGYLSSC